LPALPRSGAVGVSPAGVTAALPAVARAPAGSMAEPMVVSPFALVAFS
jgi:hypothetical protein